MDSDMELTLKPFQSQAIESFRELAKAQLQSARTTISQIVKMGNLEPGIWENALDNIQKKARVCINFHPDRLDSDGLTVSEGLLKSRRYKSQFETMISNGSVSASPGGDRDLWEQKLFEGAYSFDTCVAKDRPKYGSSQLIKHADGASPNFGSCYFVLKASVTKRATFTYLDSHRLPRVRSSIDTIEYVLSELLTDSFYGDHAFGEKAIRPRNLITQWAQNDFFETFNPTIDPIMRNSAHYIEAQIHGDIQLDRDIEYLVIDPSFKESDHQLRLSELSNQCGFPLFYHGGFQMNVKNIPLDYRGNTMPLVARKVASDGILTPKKIGTAVQLLRNDPKDFINLGKEEHVLQELKLLWHILLRFGHYSSREDDR